MELSLASSSSKNKIESIGSMDPRGCSSTTTTSDNEKEHMFDKVVTPSDVGKLNRLVIPKQHAEKYFPLDSSSDEKGLLLNFEDRNGKPWRFRYSYWNSSQSYVMTKGWSRFVKDKKLEAGDIVSFHRGVGELGRHKLYIDWKRRVVAVPDYPVCFNFSNLEFQNQPSPSVRWGIRLYPVPSPQSLWTPRSQYSSIITPQRFPHDAYAHTSRLHQLQLQQQDANNIYCSRPRPTQHHQFEGLYQNMGLTGGDPHDVPMVIDSVPVVYSKTPGKRLRLFGVNMECGTIEQDDDQPSVPFQSMPPWPPYCSSVGLGTMVPVAQCGAMGSQHFASSSLPQLQMRSPVYDDARGRKPIPSSTMQLHEFLKKGKTSLSFDLDDDDL